MKEYMMIFRHPVNENDEKPSPEEMKAAVKQWQDWIAGIARQGNFTGTNRLLPEGTTLKQNEVTDGPYVEAKEVIGGFLMVKADSMADAAEIAKECPGLQSGGTVEIRPVMAMDADTESESFLEEKVGA